MLIHNQKLYEKIRELTLSVLGAYDQFMAEGGWRHILYGKDPRILFLQLFSWGRGKEWLERISEHETYLKNFFPCTDIFESCIECIVHDEELDRINEFSAKLKINLGFRELLRDILIDFLCYVIEDSRNWPEWMRRSRFHLDASIESLYQPFEDFLYADRQCFKFLLPLVNFKCEATQLDEIVLDNHVMIRFLTPREHEEMERVPDVFKKSLTMQQVFPSMFVLEFVYETDKWGNLGTPENRLLLTNDLVYAFNIGKGAERGINFCNITDLPNELRNALPKAISALRLFKNGDVGFVALYFVFPAPMSPWIVENAPSGCRPPPPTARGRVDEYVIEKSEIQELKEFWKKFSSANISPINLALRRFNFAYERELIEDKLIDLMITLESLYPPRGRSKAVELSRALSNDLSTTQNEKYEMKKYTFIAYKCRNATIHQNKRLPEMIEYSFNEDCRRIMDFVNDDKYLSQGELRLLALPREKGSIQLAELIEKIVEYVRTSIKKRV